METFFPHALGDPYYQELATYPYLPGGEVVGHACIAVFRKGEYLSHYDKPLVSLYCLISGRTKISMLHEDGKRSIIQFLDKGQYVGELSLLEVEDSPKEVVALQECICIAFPFDYFKPLMLSSSCFLRHMSTYLARKALQKTERSSASLNYPLKNRLAAFILAAMHGGIYRERHTETAEYLGVSYRHLLYSLKQLQEEGILIKEEQGYFITDEDALLEYARGVQVT